MACLRTGMEPGTMSELPDGWDVKFNDPPGAGTEYAEFMRLNLMAFASRVGIPYEVLTGDLRDISDRALRLLLLEFRRLIDMDRWLYIIPMFCGRIRDAWWDAAVLDGALSAPGYATERDTYTETLWVPNGWSYSHPVQDVEADMKAIRAGLASRNSVILANGDDPEQIDAEQVADNARADALGLMHDSDGRQAKNGPAAAMVTTNSQDQNQ
jgi:lambda family phage portal protein